MARSKSEFKIRKGKLINHTSITESEFAEIVPFFETCFDNILIITYLTGKSVNAHLASEMIVFLKIQKMPYFFYYFI